ncbi:hypothetical protein ANCCAN_18416 [Ancylostoma caninum]|uniref:Uncharacterized protein n=1 Tax=Ancylostoma caninum TaxID=29170 RepID=A0A368FUF3_ANCCA|nr:hypothetical protein ANCCAN_18416 [Ancylostoma caninum]
MFLRVALRTRSFLTRQLPVYRCASTTPTTTHTGSDVQTRKDDDMLETIDIEDLPRAQKRFAKQFEKVKFGPFLRVLLLIRKLREGP